MNATQTRQLWNAVKIGHRHCYTLMLIDGVLFAVCECGRRLMAAQVEAILNAVTEK